jgi:hypothetical protein
MIQAYSIAEKKTVVILCDCGARARCPMSTS